MAGTLSTLGIGSDGALSYDIIDKLKDADKSAIVKPIEQKIELNRLKQDKLSELTSLVRTLGTEVVNMSDPALYQAKEATVTGSAVSVEAELNAPVGEHTLNVTQLATSDIKQSQTGYAYDGALMGEGTMHLEIDGKSFDIEVSATDSIKDVVKKINENTDGKIEASLLNTGGDNPYRLILKSAETGEKNSITVTGDFAFDQVGSGAKDASFTFDGIQISRASNHVEDLIDGLKIDLKQEGTTTVSVTQNQDKLLEGMEKFVEAYNKMVQAFTESTKFDKTTKDTGLFQGNSAIRLAVSTLKDALVLTKSKEGKTIADFGLELQRDGTLSLDKNKLKTALQNDPKAVENFFRGTDGRNGAFNRLDSAIFDIKTSSKGILKSLGNDLKAHGERLSEEKKSAEKRLEDRYNIMTRKFAAYDAVIAKLKSQGDSLQAMIDAELAQKK